MPHKGDPTGRNYLERRSRLAKRLSESKGFQRIQVVDDNQFEGDVLASLLRKVLGRAIEIDTARSLTSLPRLWAAAMPDLVFLDDRLGHIASANASIPLIRKYGYRGPIVVVAGLLTRPRRLELARIGASATLHKDEYDTTSVLELLLKLLDVPEDSGDSDDT
jgi:DNA-binding NarL/FixJ family response regulator